MKSKDTCLSAYLVRFCKVGIEKRSARFCPTASGRFDTHWMSLRSPASPRIQLGGHNTTSRSYCCYRGLCIIIFENPQGVLSSINSASSSFFFYKSSSMIKRKLGTPLLPICCQVLCDFCIVLDFTGITMLPSFPLSSLLSS